jgi:hypothetical protein
MATVDATWRSPASFAASHSLDAEIEASLAGSTRYPDGTVFVPEDLADDVLVKEYRSGGSTVAVVSDDGTIALLGPNLARAETIAIGLILAGLVLWAMSRNRGAVHTAA